MLDMGFEPQIRKIVDQIRVKAENVGKWMRLQNFLLYVLISSSFFLSSWLAPPPAGQTDADVERHLAQRGSPAGGGLPQGLRSNQRGSPGTKRQPQHPPDSRCVHGEREGQQVRGFLLTD